jgi:amino acid adenylation domain-containing protein
VEARANRLARRLRALGVGPEVLVGLAIERSPEMIIALLAVLGAGGAYLPLDPRYPRARLAFLMQDAGAPLVVARADLRGSLPEGPARVLCLDAEAEAIAAESAEPLDDVVAASALAYVIYTSGSTGRPKGVLIEHGGLSNLVAAQRATFDVSPESRVIQLASLGFDASIFEIAMAFGAGAALHLADDPVVVPGPGLVRELRARGITHATLPPSVLAALPYEPLPELRELVSAGEACPGALAARWAQGRRFFNAYGPTEATVWATVHAFRGGAGAPPIGRAIPGATTFLLDHAGRPVAAGEAGELVIGGAGVARGYLGRPELTAARFVESEAGRVYRTGDRARSLPDGDLVFLGRLDAQVKVRGFRVEPGEIEAALERHHAVERAVVVAREDRAGELRLIAYVVARLGAPADHAGWRAFLAAELPEHLVPSAFVGLAALPLSPNGKIDRAALPAPRPTRAAYVAPRTTAERSLADAWAEVLGAAPVGVADDFLELGGDSLCAARIVALARDRLGVELPATSPLEDRTVEAMARRAEAAQRAGAPIPRQPGEGPFPLSSAQQRLWFLHQLAPESAAYALPIALRLRGPLDVAVLARALDDVLLRHEALRTTFPLLDGAPVQRVAPPFAIALAPLPAAAETEPARAAHLEALARAACACPFDLGEGPVLRAALVRFDERDHALLLVLHHIAVDGGSMRVLGRDLGACYTARLRGEAPRLPPLPVRYADFAAWERSAAGDERDLAFFREALAGAPPLLPLPLDRSRPAVQSFRGRRCALRFAAPPGAMEALALDEGASLFMVLLAAFAALLHAESGVEDLVIGTPVAGRTRSEVSDVVGFFANTLAIRVPLDGDPTFRDLLGRVRARALAAAAHQGAAFERVVEALRPARSAAHAPVFQVMLALQAPPIAAALGPDLALEAAELPTGAAPFDLAVQVWRGAEAVEGFVDFAADLFDDATVAAMMDRFGRLLEEAVRRPDRRLRALVASLDTAPPALPEVEAALAALPEVEDCAARLVRDRAGLSVRLSWFVPSAGHAAPSLDALPPALRPDACVAVAAIPLTDAGAVDVAALLAVPVLDEALAQRWETALRARPGATDAVAQIEEATRAPRPRLHVADLLPVERRAPAIEAYPQGGAPPPVEGPPAFVDGGPLEIPASEPRTLRAALERAAGGSAGMILVASDGAAERLPYAALLDRARRVLTGLRASGLGPGDRVIVHVEPLADLFAAFWGAVLGGITPAIVTTAPTYDAPNPVTTKLLHAWSRLGRPLVLTSRALAPAVAALAAFPEAPPGATIRVLAVEDLEAHPPAATLHEARPEEAAFFQLTSGSTGVPKAIPETHRAVAHHVYGAARRNGYAAADVALNWMPLDHVGSIITSHLKDVFLGCVDVQVRTDRILAEPLAWLDLIEEHRVTHTWAPNFGYRLVADALAAAPSRRWDLSSLRRCMNGGEQVMLPVVREFMAAVTRFGVPRDATQPAFGMAEIATAITYNNELDPLAEGGGLVDLGPPNPGVQLRIVDADDRLLPEGVVGRMQVRGPTVMPGYLDDEAANRAAFSDDGWLVSGDLGVLRGGRLSLTGREKEMIIVCGANFACHEIEDVVGSVAGVDPTWAAACAVPDERSGSEGLAVLFVPREPAAVAPAEVVAAIRARVTAALGIAPHVVLSLPRALFPRTTSGKIQRAALREALVAGRFDALRRDLERAIAAAGTLPDWFARTVWRRREEAPRCAARGRTLILGGRGPLGATLLAALQARGEDAVLAEPGAAPALAGPPAQIVHLADAGPEDGGDDVDAVEARALAAASGLLSLLQALSAANAASAPVRLFVVSCGAQAVLSGDVPRVDLAPLPALVQTAAQELPWLDARSVDLPLADGGADVAALAREIELGGRDREVAWRDGQRFAARLERVDLTALPERASPFRRGGRYVLAGGLGGVGMILARELISAHRADLLLLGRSAPAASPGEPAQALADLVALAARTPGAGVRHEVVDVADPDALERAVAQAEERWGAPLDGVVHLAAVLRERPLGEETRAGLAEALRPRLRGALAIARLLAARPEAAYLAVSSVNGALGGYSMGAYAAASRCVEQHAEALRRGGRAGVRALSFSLWDEVGMSRGYALKQISRARGYHAITAPEGLDALRVALRREAPSLLVGLDASARAVERRANEALPLAALRAWVVGTDAGDDAPRDRFGRAVAHRVTRVDALPRAADGSIDLGALRRLDLPAARAAVAEVAPRSELERRVAEIWREALRLPRVGVHDNFFDLGGHSMLLAQVRGRLRQAFEREVSVVDLFRRPTIAALAAWLGDVAAERAPGEGAEERARKQRAALEKQRQRLQARRGAHG